MLAILLLPGFALAQYTGGSDDGSSHASFCGSNLNGGVSPAITFNALVGSTSFCSFNSELYSISLATGFANTFTWSLPPGSTIISSINTSNSSTVVIEFGNANGNISVTADNTCFTGTSPPVAMTAISCNNYLGGIDDGTSINSFCASNLNSGVAPAIALNAITGPGTFCSDAPEKYTITLSAGNANTYYWTNTVGTQTAQTIPTLTSSSVNIEMGAVNGSITVEVSNGCTSAMETLPVTATVCGLTFGGSDDGFSFSNFCASDLNGSASPAIALNLISGPAIFCSNSPENYSISLAAGYANSFYWTNSAGTVTTQTVPTLTASSVNFLMGAANGTVTVEASNGCTSAIENLVLTALDCGLSFGGSEDGFSFSSFCGSDLNGGSAPAITLNAINGPGSFCSLSSEGYNVSLSSGIGSTYYWTGPSGATLVTQQHTLTSSIATLLFGASNGNVAVEVSNTCSVATATLPVTSVNCNNFVGGNNDGFSTSIFCSNSLNGGALAPITLNPITGGGNVFFNLGQNFSVTLATGNASVYSWTGPPGSNSPAQVSSLTSSTALINIVNSNGNVTVDVSNGCTTAQAVLAVTGSNCPAFFGGISDGFAVPIELVSFTASIVDQAVHLHWVTASEHNNDFSLLRNPQMEKALRVYLKLMERELRLTGENTLLKIPFHTMASHTTALNKQILMAPLLTLK
ncbi:MAG: hypothetical protein HC811_11605 [Flammeovirgaceae bacterium]|nr:hypothetical protein [Flammeovirgaceae bacterium]